MVFTPRTFRAIGQIFEHFLTFVHHQFTPHERLQAELSTVFS